MSCTCLDGTSDLQQFPEYSRKLRDNYFRMLLDPLQVKPQALDFQFQALEVQVSNESKQLCVVPQLFGHVELCSFS